MICVESDVVECPCGCFDAKTPSCGEALKSARCAAAESKSAKETMLDVSQQKDNGELPRVEAEELRRAVTYRCSE